MAIVLTLIGSMVSVGIAAAPGNPTQASDNEGVYDAAAAHYRAGRYVDALETFRRLADVGDPRAQTILGIMYSFGEGTPRDLAQAQSWYEKAANANYPPALFGLGLLYSDGGEIPQDLERAQLWLSRAARLGHRAALERLRVVDPKAYAKVLASLPQLSPLPSREDLLQRSSRRHRPRASAGTRPVPARPEVQPSAPTQHGVSGQSAVYVQLVASSDEQRVVAYGRTLAAAHPDWFNQLDQRVERARISDRGTIVSSRESESAPDTKPWFRLQIGPFVNSSASLSFRKSIIAAEITGQCFLPR
jgi:TPR repeat protein